MASSKQTPSGKKQGLSLELEELKKASLALRALNHDIRQEIVDFIHNKGETPVTNIYRRLRLEQSLTSTFLAMLRRANIVKTRRDGQTIYYSINYDHISQFEKGLKLINGN